MRGHLVPLFLWFVGQTVHKSTGRSIFLSKIHEENNTDIVKMINKQIITPLNHGGDPCNDFYDFVCGKFIVDSPRPTEENKLFEVLASVANGSMPNQDSSPKWKRLIVTYMKRCTAAHHSPPRNAVPVDLENFRNLSHYFGGWKLWEEEQSVESRIGRIWRERGVNVIFRAVDLHAEENKITLVAAGTGLDARVRREIKTVEAFHNEIMEHSDPSTAARYLAEEGFVELMKAGHQIDDLLDSNMTASENISITDVKQFNLADFLHAAITTEQAETFESAKKEKEMRIILSGMDKDTLESIGEVIQGTGIEMVSDWLKMRAFVSLETSPQYEEKAQHYLGDVESCFERTFKYLNLAATRFVIEQTMDDRGQLDMIIMSTYIKEAFRSYFSNMPNVSDLTRINLLNKLANLKMDLGWPRWIKDDAALDGWYNGLELTEDMSLDQMDDQLIRFELGKRSEAGRQPHLHSTVPPDHRSSYESNARYDPESNSLYMYPGIIVPPNYSPFYPAAVNFGGLGGVIAHEIGHAFDLNNLHVDYKGVAVWSISRAIIAHDDRQLFENSSNCLISYYNKQCIYIDNETDNRTCTDGEATAGDNEADVLGTKMAFRGFQLWLQSQGSRYDELDRKSRYSDEQLFFASFARSHCRKVTLEDAILDQAHAFSPFRVIGALSQDPAFQQTFNCTTGLPMAPKERCGFLYHEEKPKTVHTPF